MITERSAELPAVDQFKGLKQHMFSLASVTVLQRRVSVGHHLECRSLLEFSISNRGLWSVVLSQQPHSACRITKEQAIQTKDSKARGVQSQSFHSDWSWRMPPLPLLGVLVEGYPVSTHRPHPDLTQLSLQCLGQARLQTRGYGYGSGLMARDTGSPYAP